jgi:hypothetical protein
MWVVSAAVALAVSAAVPAGAEPLRLAQSFGSQSFGPQSFGPQSFGPDVLPPYEVVTVIRSAGLDPLTRPFLRGRHYVIRAIDRDDREVRVLVDARRGEIVRIVPVAVASRGLTMGPYERMDRDAPPPGRDVGPGYDDGDPPSVVYGDEPMEGTAPRPPAAVPGAPGARAMPAPVTRSAPVRGAELSPLPEPRVITADPRRVGSLPPPPERFPHHAAVPANPASSNPAPSKPKPAKRNVASIPKQAPLPRPRPEPRIESQPQAGSGQAGHEPVGKSTASSADAPAAVAPPAAAAQSSSSGAAAEKPAVRPTAPPKTPPVPRHPADEVPN